MDKLNKDENRAKNRATRDSKYSAHAQSLFVKSFSVAENIRVELHTAEPDYSREKTLSGSAPLSDQADPNATPPSASEIWDLKGYRGAHGYVVLDNPETVDIELWCLDPQNNKWFRAATAQAISSYEEFRFPDHVRGRSIWLRLVNIGATITAITLRLSAE